MRNNLQVITQLSEPADEQARRRASARDALREAQARIQALALVHNQLYRESNLDQIDVARLLPSLSQNVIKIYGAIDRVTLSSRAVRLVADRRPRLAARAAGDRGGDQRAQARASPTAAPARSGSRPGRSDERPVLRIADDGVGMAVERARRATGARSGST